MDHEDDGSRNSTPMAGARGPLKMRNAQVKAKKAAAAGPLTKAKAKPAAAAGKASAFDSFEKMKAAAAAVSTEQHAKKGGVAGQEKPRLSESDIMFILAMKSEPSPTAEDFCTLRSDNPLTIPGFPADYVEEGRRHLAEKASITERINALWDEFRDDVKAQYSSKGYVEVDDDYFEERAKSEQWVKEQWATLDWSKFDLYRPGDEGYDGFMCDYEEGAVVDYGEDREGIVFVD